MLTRRVLLRCLQYSVRRLPSLRLLSSARPANVQAPPYISPISQIAESLVPRCSSCGITLQSTDSSKDGYYREPTNATPKNNPLDSVFDSHFGKMSLEDQKLLLNGADDLVPSLKSEVRQLRANKKKESKVQCVRCRHANYKAAFDLNQFPMEPVSGVIETIPPGVPLVYVVSAVDFPMSINKDVFKYRLPRLMKFVVTKTDLLFTNKDMVNKYGQRFFQDYFERTYKVPRENVLCVSGTSDWNGLLLLDEIQDGLYIIGTVNSGKSTLILLLLHTVEKRKSELPNARRERQIQKLANEAIAQGRKPPSRMSLVRLDIKKIAAFKSQHGPGTSYMPGFTRGNLPFQLTKNKIVYDVPGFSDAQNTRLYDIIEPQHIKHLLKSKKVSKLGMYDSHYETVKAGQVLTVGGLFFLQVPEKAMLQVRNCLNHKPHVFKSLEKAMDVFRGLRTPALKDVFLVDPAKAQLKKYIVPSFHGKKDIVFQFMGHIVITPVGSNAATEPFTLYLPEGIEAILRQPITNYITTTLSGRDANGNPLRKENWKSKSTKEVKRWTAKIPFYSDLIPVESSSASESEPAETYVQQQQRQYLRSPDEIDADSEYRQWFQKN